MRYLLDTCVLTDLIARTPPAPLVEWIEAQDERSLYLSVLTLGELHGGIARLEDERGRRRLHTWVETDLRDRFRGRVLGVDEAVARSWGKVLARRLGSGERMSFVEGLLAATALENDLVVVSRSASALAASGVEVVDPWKTTG